MNCYYQQNPEYPKQEGLEVYKEPKTYEKTTNDVALHYYGKGWYKWYKWQNNDRIDHLRNTPKNKVHSLCRIGQFQIICTVLEVLIFSICFHFRQNSFFIYCYFFNYRLKRFSQNINCSHIAT